MEKIKNYNALAIFSLLLAIFPYVLMALEQYTDLLENQSCGERLLGTIQPASFLALVAAIISLILIKKRQQKGKWFAIIAIALGLFGTIVFIPMC